MELSISKIKKFLIFPEMELSSFIFFFYFRKELPSLKNKKIRSEKISYIFSKKLFLYSGKRNFLILCKKSFSYISGNGTF